MSHSVKMLVITTSIALLAAVATGTAAPLLINAQQADYRTRPEYIRDHFAHIGSVVSTMRSETVSR